MTVDEIINLPERDEIVMVSGVRPIRAKKARFYEDARLAARILPPPDVSAGDRPARDDDWSTLPPSPSSRTLQNPARRKAMAMPRAGRMTTVRRTISLWCRNIATTSTYPRPSVSPPMSSTPMRKAKNAANCLRADRR
jgi:hypothetical protein